MDWKSKFREILAEAEAGYRQVLGSAPGVNHGRGVKESSIQQKMATVRQFTQFLVGEFPPKPPHVVDLDTPANGALAAGETPGRR